MAESPLVLLSGKAAYFELGHAPFQEMNQVEMAKSVTKGSWMVKEAAQIGQQVQKAMRLAMDGRTGPGHLIFAGRGRVKERNRATPR
jgi:acetolactate synthase-1/2/3 large subunit